MCYDEQVEECSAKLLDVVAVLANKPEFGLLSGQIGTVVELLAPGVFEIEFCDVEGRTVRFAELAREEFLVLRHEPAAIA